MASITAVKQAIRRGEHGEARTLIGQVLRSCPTAEAYYVAATLEISPARAIAHLERALALQPDHQAALGLMHMLEYRRSSYVARLPQAVLAEMETTEMIAVPSASIPESIGYLIYGEA